MAVATARARARARGFRTVGCSSPARGLDARCAGGAVGQPRIFFSMARDALLPPWAPGSARQACGGDHGITVCCGVRALMATRPKLRSRTRQDVRVHLVTSACWSALKGPGPPPDVRVRLSGRSACCRRRRSSSCRAAADRLGAVGCGWRSASRLIHVRVPSQQLRVRRTVQDDERRARTLAEVLLDVPRLPVDGSQARP